MHCFHFCLKEHHWLTSSLPPSEFTTTFRSGPHFTWTTPNQWIIGWTWMCSSFIQALGSSSGPAFKILSWLCQALLSGFYLRLHWPTHPSLSSWYQTHFTPLSSFCFVSSHLSIMTNKAQLGFPKKPCFQPPLPVLPYDLVSLLCSSHPVSPGELPMLPPIYTFSKIVFL